MIISLSHALRVTFTIPGLDEEGRPTRVPVRNYQLVVYDPFRSPMRKYISLGTMNPREAVAEAARWQELIRSGQVDIWTSKKPATPAFATVTLEAAVQEYHDARRLESGKSGEPIRESTERHERSVLRKLVGSVEGQLFKGVPLRDVRTEHVHAFAFRRGVQPGTIATQLNLSKRFFKWCVQKGHLSLSPVQELKGPRAIGKVTFFSRRQYIHLLRHIWAHLRAKGVGLGDGGVATLFCAIILGTEAGLRRGEICQLRWQDVDLRRGIIRVVDSSMHRTKTGESRAVPIVGRALTVLRRLRALAPPEAEYIFPSPEGNAFRSPYLSVKFKQFARGAGLPPELTFHSTRHTYATWLAEIGTGPFVIQALLGHRSGQMTQRYTHVAGSTGRSAVKRLFGRKPR